MTRQETNWGYIDWLESDEVKHKITLKAGIVTIYPHAHMTPHIHFTEQVLYTLCGTGYSLVDDQQIEMSQAGMMFHWNAGVIHEMFNTGDCFFRHLMVSCPDTLGIDQMQGMDDGEKHILDQETDEYLRMAIRGTQAQFLETPRYSRSIFDFRGQLVSRTKIFPAYCREHCAQELKTNTAPCMVQHLELPFRAPSSFECPKKLRIFYAPIVFRDVFLG